MSSRREGAAAPFDRRPLPMVAWVAGLALVAGASAWRIVAQRLGTADRSQQLVLVEALARGDLHGALVGTRFIQTAPPGYGLFALPFHAALQWWHGPLSAYLVAGWASLALLGVGALLVSRAVGVPPRSVRELGGVALVLATPTVQAPIVEAYHPGDLLASALVLFAIAAAARSRVGWAILALGLGLLTKQWVIVPIAVLAAMHTGRDRVRLGLGPFAVFGLVLAPFLLANPAATFNAISATDVIPTDRSLFGRLDLTSPGLLALEARILPLVPVAILCLWLAGRAVRWPAVAMVSATAAALLVRPILDPAGYAYYYAPGWALLALAGRRWAWPVGACGAGALLVWAMGPFGHAPALAALVLVAAIGVAAVAAALAQLVRQVQPLEVEPSAAER